METEYKNLNILIESDTATWLRNGEEKLDEDGLTEAILFL